MYCGPREFRPRIRTPIGNRTLSRVLVQHSQRFGSDRTASLNQDFATLSKQLLHVRDLSYSQSDLATLFKRNKATVSRWVNEEPAAGARIAH